MSIWTRQGAVDIEHTIIVQNSELLPGGLEMEEWQYLPGQFTASMQSQRIAGIMQKCTDEERI